MNTVLAVRAQRRVKRWYCVIWAEKPQQQSTGRCDKRSQHACGSGTVISLETKHANRIGTLPTHTQEKCHVHTTSLGRRQQQQQQQRRQKQKLHQQRLLPCPPPQVPTAALGHWNPRMQRTRSVCVHSTSCEPCLRASRVGAEGGSRRQTRSECAGPKIGYPTKMRAGPRLPVSCAPLYTSHSWPTPRLSISSVHAPGRVKLWVPRQGLPMHWQSM